MAGVPERGAEKKFLTRSIWLNNNKLTNTKNVDQLAHSVLEYPEELGWIDFSFNYITEIDEVTLLSLKRSDRTKYLLLIVVVYFEVQKN